MPTRLVKDPVYKQLNQILRDLIRSGKYTVGDHFLTERAISEQFGVSRATANKALSNLVAEGVLEFKKGVGTFVRGRVLDYDVRSLVSFTQKARDAGKRPSTRVVQFERLAAEDAGDEVSTRLGVKGGEGLYYMERLRLANRRPVILERRYVVARYCPDLTRAAVKDSLYVLWADRYRLDIAGADQTIRAVSLRSADAKRLKARAGAAGLLITSVGHLSGGAPLWYEQTLYRGDAYEFRNRLGPLQTARPATGALVDLADGKT
jgi:GntR family transcriptional regulator